MIYYREWCEQREDRSTRYTYHGWFLFNCIPLYVKRYGITKQLPMTLKGGKGCVCQGHGT